MATGTDKKKINRALKRRIENGTLAVEDAHFQRRQTASASSNASGAAASAPQSPPYPPAELQIARSQQFGHQVDMSTTQHDREQS